MKIFFLCRSLSFGGAERQLLLLADGLIKKNHDVTVITFYNLQDNQSYTLPKNLKLVSLNKKSRWDILIFLKNFLIFLRREKPDVLHGYLVVPNLLTVLAKFIYPKIKIVWGLRGSGINTSAYDWLTNFTLKLEKFFSNKADLIIVNSEAGYRDAKQFGYQTTHMHVIENGIEYNHFQFNKQEREEFRSHYNINESAFIIGMVGRLDPMKGHAVLINAFKKLKEEYPYLFLICMGDGDQVYKNRQIDLAEKLGISKSILWLPAQKIVPYSAFDILCLPSLYGEGFPNVLVEAMAYGLPCIATDVGDSKRIINNLNYIVFPNNSELLFKFLNKIILMDDAERKVLGNLNRYYIETNFSVKNLVEKTEKLLIDNLYTKND